MAGIRILFMLLVAASPFAVPAQVDSLPSQPHLLVKGEASRTVVPDRSTVDVQLEAIDIAPEAARARPMSKGALFKAVAEAAKRL